MDWVDRDAAADSVNRGGAVVDAIGVTFVGVPPGTYELGVVSSVDVPSLFPVLADFEVGGSTPTQVINDFHAGTDGFLSRTRS